MNTPQPTHQDVAAWMATQIDDHGVLDQYDAAHHIEQHFGPEFVYENESGGTGIDKKVLRLFGKLTKDTAVWEPHGKEWQRRTDQHSPGRLQE